MISFVLDYSNGVPIYRQIIDQILFGIETGQLKLGEQLPTVRALAVTLKVNLNTVSKAYKELEIKNVLNTHQGSGTYINRVDNLLSEKDRARKLTDLCNQFATVAAAYGFTIEDIKAELSQCEILNKHHHEK